jgi:hypothetical protein
MHDAAHAARGDRPNVTWVGCDARWPVLPLPRDARGGIVLAVDVSAWLRPDAATAPDRSFCHVYGRGKSAAQLIPGWPYSFVAALEPGRSSWTVDPRSGLGLDADPEWRRIVAPGTGYAIVGGRVLQRPMWTCGGTGDPVAGHPFATGVGGME